MAAWDKDTEVIGAYRDATDEPRHRNIFRLGLTALSRSVSRCNGRMGKRASVGATEVSNRKCLRASVDFPAARNESDSTAFDVVERRVNRSAQLTKDTPSCCTNRPGKNYVFVIRLMARDVRFSAAPAAVLCALRS